MLGGEITCEPACPGVDAQARLHAGKVIAGRLKGLQGCAQLVSLRPVLGVVDHRECSGANGRATLSAFGFVAGPTAVTGITVMGIRCLRAVICRAGGIIFRFDCDDYVKFFRRIV
jgi:hypothetical protein